MSAGAISEGTQHARSTTALLRSGLAAVFTQTAAEASLPPQVAAIRSWLDALDVTADFDANRSGMIEKILVLQQVLPAAR